jgi:hypothetical protein
VSVLFLIVLKNSWTTPIENCDTLHGIDGIVKNKAHLVWNFAQNVSRILIVFLCKILWENFYSFCLNNEFFLCASFLNVLLRVLICNTGKF